MKTNARFYDLDLIRFVAAGMVVIYHYTFRGYTADEMSMVEFSTLAPFFKYGYLGVDLFFIVSGFVILMTARNKDCLDFINSRIVRLYPAFWICVSITALTMVLAGGERYTVSLSQYFFQLSMISGFFDVKQVDGVYWSLLVELKFYFLIFLVILLNQLSRIKFLLFLWATLSSVMFFVHIPVLNFFLFPSWSHYFIAGATFYLVRDEGFDLLKVLTLILCLTLSIAQNLSRTLEQVAHYGVNFSDIFVSFHVLMFYAVFFLVSVGKTQYINRKVFLSLGALTYPLYLVHQNVGYILLNHLSNAMNKYVLLVLVILFSVTISYFVNKLLELKVNRQLNKWLRQITTKHVRTIKLRHSR